MTQHVKVVVDEGVMTVTLQRPEKKNSITSEMYGALSEALERAESDPLVKVVLFEADGDSFCAGNDLGDFVAAADSSEELPATRYIRNLVRLTKPLVAAVQGNAVGIGATMLLHCDLVYLAENVRLMTPFATLAIVPEAASSILLHARVGHPKAFAMFALGEPMDAPTALAFGIANATLPLGSFQTTARNAAKKLAAGSAGAIRQTKQLMRDQERLLAQVGRESVILEQRVRGAQVQEAVKAFTERRAPVFLDE